MSWRHIMITQNAKLSVRYNQLVIQQNEIVTIPLQDVASILIEAKGVVLSSQLLVQLARHKVSLFTCDEKMLPNGIWVGFHQHSRQLTVLTMQLALSKALKKRIWQQIVQRKILNQALCLEYLDKGGVEELKIISKTVASGDTSNREAYAAKQYFQFLFGTKFTRRSDELTNCCLNYGYAIMRGIVARSLANYGFSTCLGIYHENQLNSFNLADDFMETLRPIVDYHVAKQEGEQWDVQTRIDLVDLLNVDMNIGGEQCSVTVAVEHMVKSFVACCRQNDASFLKLPELLPFRVHQYE